MKTDGERRSTEGLDGSEEERMSQMEAQFRYGHLTRLDGFTDCVKWRVSSA